MKLQHRPNFIHVLVAIVSAFAGAAGGGTLAASRVGLPEPAPLPCEVCAVCPEPVVPPTADEIRAKYGIAIPVPADPAATVTP